MKLKDAAKGIGFHVKFCTATYKDAGQLRNNSDAEVNALRPTKSSQMMTRFYSEQYLALWKTYLMM